MVRNWKKAAWHLLTVTVVVFLLFNPEAAQLALFIDAIGLDLFVLLLQLQLITIFTGIYQSKIRPVVRFAKQQVLLHLSISAPAMLMLSLATITLTYYMGLNVSE